MTSGRPAGSKTHTKFLCSIIRGYAAPISHNMAYGQEEEELQNKVKEVF